MSVPTTAVRPCQTVPTRRRPPRHDGGDCRDSVGLAALPVAIPLLRSFARAKLSAWGLESALGWQCRQVLSELATNAFDATGHPAPSDLDVSDDRTLAMILVQLRVSAGQLIAEVRDPSNDRPELATPGTDEEGGRGLRLAHSLANEWGWYPITRNDSKNTMTGKVVWASWLLAREEGNP
ncbi:ATP-binding protein [Actinomadura rubrisoli]|uniref:ATP-binding protein n=1 Tax=Actinomadura rubrisoli TaxID=2530368 RepID=A0A4R5ADM1_9ACTN|nr:ATP-binding protein [Actinomadura rubrisoli]TDD69366.1 ATP-binding protein [Actinomadura rubrisoli]